MNKMQSSFNPDAQAYDLESKIVVALERLSEVFRVLLWNEAKVHKLSPVQLQILIFLKYHSSEKCKVAYLAREFNMTKPTISDAVKTLASKSLVCKETDAKDSRSLILTLSKKGMEIASKVELFSENLKSPLKEFPHERKEVLLSTLMELIFKLNNKGVITPPRMCFNCEFLVTKNKAKYYCNQLKETMAVESLRMDCPVCKLKETSEVKSGFQVHKI